MTEEVDEAGRVWLVELYDALSLDEMIELEKFVSAVKLKAGRLVDIYDKPSRDWLTELHVLVCELCLAIQVKSDTGHALAAQAARGR